MRKKQDNDTIYAAALRMFSRYGYRKTTMEDIAAELGMTAAGIYAYADSKRELYEQTVRYAMLRWQGRVRAAVDGETGAAAKLVTMCRSALYYLSEETELRELLKSDPTIFPMFPTVDPYEEINAESMGIITDILTLGSQTGEFRQLDIEAVAQVMFAMYKSFIVQAYYQGETEFLENHLPQTLDLLLRGMERK